MNKFLKYISIVTIVLGVVFVVQTGVAQNIKFSPIKPQAKQNALLTDEQQGILAVRKAKASVVNIVGRKNDIGPGKVISGIDITNGTGIVWSADGYIVSNSHVVEDVAFEYEVVFADGSSYPAKVVGKDKYNDVALLKIERSGLTSATVGDSDALETGQTVFAIGNSLGKYQNTVSRGVVSGLGRAIDIGSEAKPLPRLQNLIQTDAAINLGNSGGPLVNMAGEVVGMNTLIENDAASIGFSVPINTVKKSVEQLKNFGKASRPYMGIQYQTITPEARVLYGFSASNGAAVSIVAKNSPAQKAGLKDGDIILEINREVLSAQNELDKILTKYQAGDQILLKVLRGKNTLELLLILEEYK